MVVNHAMHDNLVFKITINNQFSNHSSTTTNEVQDSYEQLYIQTYKKEGLIDVMKE